MTQTPAGWYPVEGYQERYWTGTEWSEAIRPMAGPPVATATLAQAPQKKKRRVFLWVFLAIQALFIIWIISGAASGSGSPDDCGTLDAETCNDAENVGTAIGVFLIVGLWMVVDFLLAVIYGIYRLAKRT